MDAKGTGEPSSSTLQLRGVTLYSDCITFGNQVFKTTYNREVPVLYCKSKRNVHIRKA